MLDEVLNSLGDKTKSCAVPGTLCAQLCQQLGALLALNVGQLQPGPGGLFPSVIQGLTKAARDPDVHISGVPSWHFCQNSTWWSVPLGLTSKRGMKERPNSLFTCQSVGATENYANYTEHRAQADEVCRTRSPKETFSGRPIAKRSRTMSARWSWQKL